MLACCLTIVDVKTERCDGYVVFRDERHAEILKSFGIAAIEDERMSFGCIFTRISFADAGRCTCYENDHGCVY